MVIGMGRAMDSSTSDFVLLRRYHDTMADARLIIVKHLCLFQILFIDIYLYIPVFCFLLNNDTVCPLLLIIMLYPIAY